ncbi:MAG: KH domain-containing protein [Candidatus Doudnabacteria bacterium]|nr:KH domain-containing protein [Candidatus Doudnabacteria bacterium]
MDDKNTEIIKNKITGLLNSMGFDCQIFERMEEGRTVFNIKTHDAQLLIGKQGANLEALQHLLRLAVKKDLDSDFIFAIDIDDYKEKRMIYLKELARKAAHQVRQTKRSVGLPIMPSFERKIVHDYLSLFSDVESESMGSEPNRRIVIKYKGLSKSEEPFQFIENS